jgi:hypothetical protein
MDHLAEMDNLADLETADHLDHQDNLEIPELLEALDQKDHPAQLEREVFAPNIALWMVESSSKMEHEESKDRISSLFVTTTSYCQQFLYFFIQFLVACYA